MSNENSETFIGVNSSWSDACCGVVTYCGDKPLSCHRGDPKRVSVYAVRNKVGTNLLTLSECEIADANLQFHAASVDGWQKTAHRLVMLTKEQAYAFILDLYDLAYLRRLGFRMVILGTWAVVL